MTSLHEVASTKDGAAEGILKPADTSREQLQLSRFAMKNDNMASNATISSVHIDLDPALLARRHEQ